VPLGQATKGTLRPRHETMLITVARPGPGNRRLIADNGSVGTTWRRWRQAPDPVPRLSEMFGEAAIMWA
jgi:hypothetical protein